jgi:hypothetical protein
MLSLSSTTKAIHLADMTSLEALLKTAQTIRVEDAHFAADLDSEDAVDNVTLKLSVIS